MRVASLSSISALTTGQRLRVLTRIIYLLAPLLLLVPDFSRERVIMTNVTESKVPCKVSFSHDVTPSVHTDPIDGVFHIFEHKYDNMFPPFWYGVIEVAARPDQLDIPRKTPNDGIRISLTTDDGRKGVARLNQAHVRTEATNYVARIAVFGIGSLKL
jgi:hypothetical protein